MTGTTLVTGADGYIGRRIAADLLANSDDRLILGLRASNQAELAVKQRRLAEELQADRLRVEYSAIDVRCAAPFDVLDPKPITRIVHAAAIIRFNVERDVAREVNVEGTARACEFALRCPQLQRFALISTLYAAGRLKGAIAEQRLPDGGFVNHYEWSKWAAEEVAFQADSDLPLLVLRLPTIVADDVTGHVTQYNAFHNTLKLLFYGLLSLLPGSAELRLPLATASFGAAAIGHLLDPRTPRGVYHVCHDPGQTASLSALIDTAFSAFERDEQFRRRRLLRPLYCDLESFADLVEAARAMRGTALHESLASVAPFGEQLYLDKQFHNDSLKAAWPEYRPGDALDLTEATSDYLVATRWGRKPGEPT